MNCEKLSLVKPPFPEQEVGGQRANFKVHPSVLRYALPLSKFAKLPSNAGMKIFVGVVACQKSSRFGQDLLVDRKADTRASVDVQSDGDVTPSALTRTKPSIVFDAEASGIQEGGNNSMAEPQTTARALVMRSAIHSSPASAQPTAVDLHLRIPSTPDGWDIPTVEVKFGLDQTLLEAVARCCRERTGLEVKEITRMLGVARYDLERVGMSAETETNEGLSGQLDSALPETEKISHGRRFDFLVGVRRGEPKLKDGVKVKWVDTHESWRIMKQIPAGTSSD